MSQQQQMMEGRSRPETSRGHYILEVLGIAAFFVLALFMVVPHSTVESSQAA